MPSGWFEILAPMPDRLLDVLMNMGLKCLFHNSGWDLVSVVCVFMRIFAIYLDLILKETELVDVSTCRTI